MRLRILAAALLLSISFSTHINAQGAFASVGGAVSDSTGALIPGVSVTALGVDTGISTTALTNDAGVYNFLSLVPGKYKITASLQGFQSAASELTLAIDSVRLNFTLKVGATAGTNVDVVTNVDT